MKICGIVGWKNSGKTFFARKLISYFTNQKFNVASIKHAHHDFDIDKPDTIVFYIGKLAHNKLLLAHQNVGLRFLN